MCSVNQLNAKIKLTEMWKMVSLPIQNASIKRTVLKDGMGCSRSITNGRLIEEGISLNATGTIINDSTRAWNKAPNFKNDFF